MKSQPFGLGEFLVKSLLRKVRRFLKKDVRMVIRYRNKNNLIYRNNLSTCNQFIDYLKFFSMNELPDFISYENHLKNAVVQNSKILDYNTFNFKWDQLCFLESYHIKRRKPELNHGIKASKEFTLF